MCSMLKDCMRLHTDNYFSSSTMGAILLPVSGSACKNCQRSQKVNKEKVTKGSILIHNNSDKSYNFTVAYLQGGRINTVHPKNYPA